jgi:hypothetical protein
MKPKKYRMTRRAWPRTRERGIPAREIQEVLDNPKVQVVQLAQSSVKAWKLVGSRKITVYADEEKASDGR